MNCYTHIMHLMELSGAGDRKTKIGHNFLNRSKSVCNYRETTATTASLVPWLLFLVLMLLFFLLSTSFAFSSSHTHHLTICLITVFIYSVPCVCVRFCRLFCSLIILCVNHFPLLLFGVIFRPGKPIHTFIQCNRRMWKLNSEKDLT